MSSRNSEDMPVTPGVRALRAAGISFLPHLYRYEEHGGKGHSAQELGVPEHNVVKTLVMRDERGDVFIVLMHGDREVSTRQLARTLNVRTVEPCDAATAQRQTGYLFGGTSPFGTRRALPVYAERTIFELEKIFINGGKRGFLVELSPLDLRKLLPITEVSVAVGP